MRSVKHTLVGCPICGTKLKGSAFSGYRCIKCKAHFTPTFLRVLRRKQFADMIERHFAEPTRLIEESTHLDHVEQEQFFIEDVQSVEAAASEARQELHLDDVLDTPEWPDVSELLKEKHPGEMLLKQRQKIREYAPHVTEKKTARKPAKKKTAKKRVKKPVRKVAKKPTRRRR